MMIGLESKSDLLVAGLFKMKEWAEHSRQAEEEKEGQPTALKLKSTREFFSHLPFSFDSAPIQNVRRENDF